MTDRGGAGTRKRSPRAIGELLPTVLTELGLTPASHLFRLLQVWDRALGADLAPYCRPEGIRHGTLVARVPDSAWMQRLQLEKPRILERLEELLGEPAARDLRFRIGPLEPAPRRSPGARDRSEPSG
jgi:predicted nucleic acid-binding Zn ribbon protein